MTDNNDPPASLTTDEVIAEEFRWLRAQLPVGNADDADDSEILSALCLSGGGIRSATFCLGVLQALAEKRILGRFHYLSTVSGGGYIGSWLSSWIGREGQSTVLDKLAQAGADVEPRPVRRLRAYTNYLSPVWGLSTDFLSLVATFIRNLALNWCVLVPLLAAALMLPRLQLAMLQWPGPGNPDDQVCLALLLVATLLVVTTIAYVVADLPRGTPPRDPHDLFVPFCYVPLLVAAVLFSWLVSWDTDLLKRFGDKSVELGSRRVPVLPLAMALAGVAVHGLAALVGTLWRKARGLELRPNLVVDLVVIFITGAVGGYSVYLVALLASSFHGESHRELFATLSVPVLLAVFWVAGTIYAGATARFKSEDDREWWARATAWWLGAGVVWIIAAVLVIYAPLWLLALPWLQSPSGPQAFGGGTALLGILTGAAGYWSKNGAQIKKHALGFIEATGLQLLDLASLAFILALILVMSIAVSCGLRTAIPSLNIEVKKRQADVSMLEKAGWPPRQAASSSASAKEVAPTPVVPASAPVAARAHVAYSAVLELSTPGLVALGIAALFIISVGISILIGVNTFSLHSMYGNRLARAYLGASNRNRRPHWFTGFDPNDNPKLADIGSSSPGGRRLFHVVNVALNLVKPAGDRLEWQQRMAASFTMSPLHCGSASLGFVRTAQYGAKDGGMSLGRAMAISGAAASPNMGYHTSKLVAFVMTFFNVRLGWWTPNPMASNSRFWQYREPLVGLKALLDEAGANATAKRGFVYLSDGGHFENLGLYEMVRRRCMRIVVVDASCDPDFEFEDLQCVLRKIRIDFGVPIEFDEPLPTPELAKSGGRHIAVGKIRYDVNDPTAQPGHLVYIKPVLSGDEPLDVERFAAANSKAGKAFPHQPTSDQFFNEAQFESYRMLGKHSVEKHFHDWETWPSVGGSTKVRRLKGLLMPSPAAATASHAPQGAPTPRIGEALWHGAADGFQTISQGKLLLAALTIGGAVAVTGTVALRENSEVGLKKDAAVGLSDEDRTLFQKGISVTVTESDRVSLQQQLERTIELIERLERSTGEHQTATLNLSNVVSKLVLTTPSASTATIAELRLIVKTLEKQQEQTAAGTSKVQSLWNETNQTLSRLLAEANEKLKSIDDAVKETPPRRTIRAITEGGSR